MVVVIIITVVVIFRYGRNKTGIPITMLVGAIKKLWQGEL